MGENDEEMVTDDIEVLKLVKLSSQKHIKNIEKESDERNSMDMIDDKEPDKRDQICAHVEERVTDDIEVLKLKKLSAQKNLDNIEKESDERNRMDTIYDKEYDERDQTGERKENELE